MKKTLRDTLYLSLKISVYVFTLIMIMFGCFYVRDQHWFETPKPQKALRTVSVDSSKEILVKAETDDNTADSWNSFSSLFEGAMQDGKIPLGEMMDAFFESELAQTMFTEEELKELRKTAEISEELFIQIMEAQKEQEK